MKAKQKDKSSKKKTFIGAFLRWGVAVALIYWVIQSGKLNLADLAWFRREPLKATFLIGAEFLLAVLAITRWWVLLQALHFKLQWRTALRLGMLGQFFSTVLPGTISGDVIKGVFVARRYPQRKARAVVTVLVDRFMGLFAVLILGGLGYALGASYLEPLVGNKIELVKSFGVTLAGIGGFLLLMIAAFPWYAGKLPKALPKWTNRIPKATFLHQFYAAVLDYREKPFVIWLSILLSMGIHVVNIGMLWMVADVIYGPGPWGTLHVETFVLAFVLGICAMQIPVAPMGLGLGQMAFSGFYLAVGAPSASFGSALITSLQLAQIVVNLTGCVFFATYRHQVEESLHSSPAETLG